MASPAQCIYCFECLSASLENRDPPGLRKVEGLWEEYQKSIHPVHESGNETSNERPEERPSGEDSAMEDSEDTDGGESQDDEEEDDIDDGSMERTCTSLTRPTARPQVPSISRLQASTPMSESSSSSTPSILSANSSNTALTTPASSTTSFSNSTSTSKQTGSRPSYSSRLSQTPSYPLFVTWNTHSRSGHKSLRGCIGTFDPLPLSSALRTYALTSAFEDMRFSPIPHSLLPSLSCNITLLADFESCSHPLDWSVGTHGLRISFVHRGKRYGATYLPDVAVEQGWTKEETLESLMRKAGWDGGGSGGAGGVARRFLRGGRDRSDGVAAGHGRHPWEEVNDFRAIRYTGLKASATYSEWREWRRWVEQNHGKVLG